MNDYLRDILIKLEINIKKEKKLKKEKVYQKICLNENNENLSHTIDII